MSKYTTEIRFLCEVESGATSSTGFNSINDILTIAAPKVFNFDFPIFDEAYRLPLEIKILRHYYTREICEETVGLWKLRLQDKLNIIMPYYNKLYSSELIQFNPLYDVDLTRDRSIVNQGQNSSEEFGNTMSNENSSSERSQNIESQTTSNTNTNSTTDNTNITANNSYTNSTNQNTNASSSTGETSTSDTTNTSKNDSRKDKYSDTPQGSITNLENDTYLTNARIINDTADDTTTASGTTSTNMSSTITDNSTNSSTTNETGSFNGSENKQSESNNAGTETRSISDNRSATKNNIVNVNKSNVGSVTNTEEYIEHIVGKQGTVSNSKMLQEFRETFLNIDKMIIDELSTLFFGLW